MRMLIEEASGERQKEIHGISGEYSPDGAELLLRWDWPENERYDLCFAFDVTQEEERRGMDLKELLRSRRPVDIISLHTWHPHRIRLSAEAVGAWLYPARFEGDAYYILDQQKGNRSEYYRRKASIRWRVFYESMDRLLRKVPCRRAVIRLEGIPQGMAGCLVYRCVGAGRDGIRFGIDLGFAAREQTLEILVGKGEKVVVELSDPGQKEYLNLTAAG